VTQRLTDKDFWDYGRDGFQPSRVQGTPFDKILRRFLPRGGGRTVAEIGAYPGGFLLSIAREFDLQPTAIDYSDHSENIAALFEYNDSPPPEVLNQDFFEMQGRQFDVVASFGFIEHFERSGPVLAKHAEMVSEGGYLVLSVPYLGGWQGLLRRLAYTDHAIRRIWMSHNTDTMNLNTLRDAVRAQGMQMLFSDYVMKGEVWIDPNGGDVKRGFGWLIRFARALNRTVLRWLPSSRHWSPMILLIARKTA